MWGVFFFLIKGLASSSQHLNRIHICLQDDVCIRRFIFQMIIFDAIHKVLPDYPIYPEALGHLARILLFRPGSDETKIHPIIITILQKVNHKFYDHAYNTNRITLSSQFSKLTSSIPL